MNRIAIALLLAIAPSRLMAVCTAVLASDTSRVSKAGDTMTGQLSMSNVPIVESGASGYMTTASSCNASAFFGNGSQVTGLSASNISAGTLGVSNGGTGNTTNTDNGVLFGNGASAIGATPAMANGGLVIGAGVGVDPATGTLTGTNAQISITNAAAKITIAGAGISSACAVGQYLGGANWGGGIANGGSCQSAGAGDVLSTASNGFNTAATNQTFGSSMTVLGGIFGTIQRSTSTQVLADPVATSFGVCHATVTMTISGSSTTFASMTSGISGSTALTCYCALLQDGRYLWNESSTVGLWMAEPGASNNSAMSGLRVIPTPVQGQHSWCITCKTTTGTCHVGGDSAVFSELSIITN